MPKRLTAQCVLGVGSAVHGLRAFPGTRSPRACASTGGRLPGPEMLTTTPVAWRLVRVEKGDDERFLVEFVHLKSHQTNGEVWTCDGIARTQEEARHYAVQHGVSAGSFDEALEHARSSPRY